MGLRDYRKYKREQELKESGVISDLYTKIKELEEQIKDLKAQRYVKSGYDNLSEDDKKKIKMALDKQTKPEDFIGLFTGNIEEFNPNA